MTWSHLSLNRKNPKNEVNKTYQNDDGVVMVNIQKLNEAITLLANNSYVELDKISPESELAQAFDLVKIGMTILFETDYDIFLSLIEKQPRPTRIYPGTAGAFLFGSYTQCYGDVDKYCSASI